MVDIREEGTPAIMALLAMADREECRAMAVHTRPRVTAVAIQALRAAVDILLAAEAAAIPRVEGADIPPVAAAIPVEAITKSTNELL
jgi:hypothetical protein